MHAVIGHFTANNQTSLQNFRKAPGNRRHLAGVYKHAANFHRLVSPTHPSLDAGVGAAGGAVARQKCRQIACTETNQWVVRVERGDDQFAHFALGHRVARARANNFNDHAFVNDKAFSGLSFIGNQAQVSRGIALVDCHAARCKPVTQAGRKRFAADQAFLHAADVAAGFLCFFNQNPQKTWGACIAIWPQFANCLQLLLGLANTRWKHRATYRM